MEIEVIPQPPARPGGPAFDPVSGVLLAAAEDIERLVAGSASLPGLEAAGAVVAGTPHPALRPALEAVAAPRRTLVVERSDGTGRAWIGARGAALALPSSDGRLALVAVRPDRVAEAIAAACGLDLARPAPQGAPLRLRAGELARRLAARAIPGLPAAVSAHWRVVEPGSPPTAVEVLDTEAGAWLVVPDGRDVELRPAAAGEILRLLRGEND